MNRELKKILVMVVVLGSWLVLFQNMYLARAKDPDYPTNPIDFIIHMGAGGSSDLASRALIKAASKHLGQPIIPINKPGASGSIAAMAIKSAKPDGYTIGVISMSTAFVVPFSEGAPYKDLTGFTWIMNFGTYIMPLVVRGDAPWKTYKEFLEWARKNPGAAKIGITGAKKTDFKGLILWQIEQREKVSFSCVPFKGSAQLVTALLGGHIQMYVSTVPRGYLQEGKIRPLLYTGKAKLPGYEHIPSTAELYGFAIPDLMAVYGPRGLPDYVVKRLEDAFTKAAEDPDLSKVMDRLGMPSLYMDSATLTKYAAEEFSDTARLYEKVKAEEKKGKK